MEEGGDQLERHRPRPVDIDESRGWFDRGISSVATRQDWLPVALRRWASMRHASLRRSAASACAR